MKIKSISISAGATLLFAAATVIGLIGCATPDKQASAGADPKTASSSAIASARGGSQMWSQNCARCHNIRPTSSYNDPQWDVSMLHMRVRANLTAVESRKILEFLKSAD